MAKSKSDCPINLVYNSRNAAQEDAEEAWKRSRILFFIGEAGTGKTACALGLALKEVLKSAHGKLMLTRPMVACEEKLGYLPGDLEEKFGPWLGPFHDCFGSLSLNEWTELEKFLEKRMEIVPIGMLRGRTISNGVLIVDEAQNCSYSQLKCILTRLGTKSRIVLCGDPAQSDLFPEQHSPLNYVANSLTSVDVVSTVRFDGKTDQLRDPVITDILSRLK